MRVAFIYNKQHTCKRSDSNNNNLCFDDGSAGDVDDGGGNSGCPAIASTPFAVNSFEEEIKTAHTHTHDVKCMHPSKVSLRTCE